MLIPLFVYVLLALSFLILRRIVLHPAEGQPSRIELYLIGIITWVFILSAAAWIIMPLYLLYEMLALGNIAAIMPLIFIATVSGVSLYLNETMESGTVLHFLRESAFFRPMRPVYMHFQEELDKKKIRDIHREISGTPFPTSGKPKKLLTQAEAQQYKEQFSAAHKRPHRSRTHDEEIASLKAGSLTLIGDAWKVYTFEHTLHDLYPEMSHLEIDPNTRCLRFDLNIPTASARALQGAQYVYSLKQDLYHLFSVLASDAWLASYAPFFDFFVAVCYGIETDSFGQTQLYPFMKIEIACAELRQREDTFFNAGDLHTISKLTFDNGKSLTEKPQ